MLADGRFEVAGESRLYADAIAAIMGEIRRAERNTLLRYFEEYLVAMAQRGDHRLLRTAYCTGQSGRIAGLRRERDAFSPVSDPRRRRLKPPPDKQGTASNARSTRQRRHDGTSACEQAA